VKIELSKPFAPSSAVDEFDVRQIKKALNRLGYYQPYEKVGITEIPDSAVFEALKAFQKDHGLPATGTAKQGDETINTLNREMANAPDGLYIWRTVEDNKVRGTHAALNRTIRNWDNAPDPGDDFNCRCWAEPIKPKNIPVIDEGSRRSK
jgi:peptidoglycan hydrolase-like protein with peptidoglycan-binding domain